MALLYSPNLDDKQSIPDFSCQAVDGITYNNESFAKFDINVFLFICNHCPYVKAIEDRIIQLYKNLKNKNVNFIAVCSNDATDYQEDSFENIKSNWLDKNFEFTYLYDSNQSLAKSMGAVCTPDIFAFNNQNKLFYRGQLDNSWRDPSKVTREDLKLAIEFQLENKTLSFDPAPSMGCSIKWI